MWHRWRDGHDWVAMNSSQLMQHIFCPMPQLFYIYLVHIVTHVWYMYLCTNSVIILVCPVYWRHYWWTARPVHTQCEQWMSRVRSVSLDDSRVKSSTSTKPLHGFFSKCTSYCAAVPSALWYMLMLNSQLTLCKCVNGGKPRRQNNWRPMVLSHNHDCKTSDKSQAPENRHTIQLLKEYFAPRTKLTKKKLWAQSVLVMRAVIAQV